MSIKTELNNLQENDIYSMILFILFKLSNLKEFSTLSELIYILDKKSLLKLCEYFGGMTITIPTIEDIQDITYGLLLYNYINIEHISYEESILILKSKNVDIEKIKNIYRKICTILTDYNFNCRGNFE